MKIKILFENDYSVDAEIYDTPTGKAIYNALPYQSHTNTWGDEIYFTAPVQQSLEPGAKAEVEVGELAYWPNMPAFCIFFGRTPISSGDKPAAAGPVNVFGKLLDTDVKALRGIADGEIVSVEAI